jgi:penicillin-binding protein A
VNKQLRHISVVALVLLAVLIVSTTYWQTWAQADLADRADNSVTNILRLTIDRGKILAADGTVLAENRKTHKHGLTIFTRHYPQNDLASQVVGYATNAGTTTGLEQSLDDYLTGANTNLSNSISQELDRLGGQTVHGDDVYLTLRPAIQRLALNELAGRCGAVVVLDAKTGAVVAMASSPTYNSNLVAQHYPQIAKIKGTCGDASALQNNATQGLYPPGSTFKLVTASAALDTGRFTPTSGFYDPGYCIEYGKKVYNSASPDSPSAHETFGHVDFAQALEHSINAVFCDIGKAIGAGTILDYAKKYGFYSQPPVDLPSSVLYPSGLYNKGKLWFPKNPAAQVDPGRLAFGQERMLVTPLQMALVGATIADKGVEPKPYLVQKIVGSNGSTVSTTTPQNLGRVLKPQTAAELNQMMQLVVQGGTGTTAQIPGIAVAGKTGTAELGLGNVYDAWFVAFAPADSPRYVVAVVVEKQPNGFGGSISAPIAKVILEKLLGG